MGTHVETERMDSECPECGYRPYPEEIEESEGYCPDCGWDPAEGGE